MTNDEKRKDPNRVTANYSCSRGHGFVVVGKQQCWCGWGRDIEVKAYETEGSWAAMKAGTDRKVTDWRTLAAMTRI